MRLIHTADWHLGRRLKGVDRTPEIPAALEQLLHQAKTLQVDAVLIAGDIFDIPNPTAAAERADITAAAQYIALGHIHAYQSIPNPTPTYYPGSLIQLDFEEAQQKKGFCLVTVAPGKTAEVEFHPLVCQRPLQVIRCDLFAITSPTGAVKSSLLDAITYAMGKRLGLAAKFKKW